MRQYRERIANRRHINLHVPGKPNMKPPRPSVCDLIACSKNIPHDQPYFTDRVWPMMIELTHSDGKPYYMEKIGHFCSEQCRAEHRSIIFARLRRAA